MGEDRKLGKIFEFLVASIISWNAHPMFYAVLKGSGDCAWEVVCWGRALPRQVLLQPRLVPEQAELCWDSVIPMGTRLCLLTGLAWDRGSQSTPRLHEMPLAGQGQELLGWDKPWENPTLSMRDEGPTGPGSAGDGSWSEDTE